MMIEDGTGSGNKAAVDSEHRLRTLAIVETNQEVVAGDDGTSWTGVVDGIVTAGAAVFLYLFNSGTEILEVTGVRLMASANCNVRVGRATGTPSGGTPVVPTNVNFGFVLLPDTNFQTGANITGLTETAVVDILGLTANVQQLFQFDSRIYVTPDTALTLRVSAAATLNGSIQFYTERD